MPIQTAVPVRVFDQEAFHRVDRLVTGFAFDIHNEFGRYLEEKLYQAELTRRCREAGLEVHAEMEIRVGFENVTRSYYADHLVQNGVIVETKAAAALTSLHTAQALNYLFLCGLHHGTLLNFHGDRVQHAFVSTTLTQDERRRFQFATTRWKPLTPQCHELKGILHRLLTEWGAFLHPSLYKDALAHFLGGKVLVEREVEVISGGMVIGRQPMHLIAEDVAFSLTASTHRPKTVLEHQRRFLNHTRLRALHWINLNHKQIELCTIEK